MTFVITNLVVLPAFVSVVLRLDSPLSLIVKDTSTTTKPLDKIDSKDVDPGAAASIDFSVVPKDPSPTPVSVTTLASGPILVAKDSTLKDFTTVDGLSEGCKVI